MLVNAERDPAGTGALELGQANVENDTNHERQDMVTLVQPLAQGWLKQPSEQISVIGATSQLERVQWRPIGATWPDGSFKYAHVTFPCRLQPNERKTVTFERSDRGEPPAKFVLHDKVKEAIGSAGFGTTKWFWRFIEGPGSRDNRLTFPQDGVYEFLGTESGIHTLVIRFRGRVPNTPYWVQLEVELLNGMSHAHFWYSWGNSDQTISTRSYFTESIHLVTRSCEPIIRWASFNVQAVNGTSYNQQYAMALLPTGDFADGQQYAAKGTMAFRDEPAPTTAADIDDSTLFAERLLPVTAVSLNWADHGTFGPIGGLPVQPASITNDESLARWARGDRSFGRPKMPDPFFWAKFTLRPEPFIAGDDTDFGAVRGWMPATTGIPTLLHNLQRGVYQEACRSTTFREPDVSPVTNVNHPLLFLWFNYPFCREGNSAASKDQLGKDPNDCNNPGRRAGPLVTGGQEVSWLGQDRQHWTNNHLWAYALMTGDRWAMQEMEKQGDLFIGAHPVPSDPHAQLFGNNPGSPRGVGRAMYSGAAAYAISGKTRIIDQLVKRVHDSIDAQVHNLIFNHTRSTFAVFGPDPKRGVGALTNYDHNRPWEDGIGLRGVWATYVLSGDQLAYDICKRVAESHVLHCWYPIGGGFWHPFTSMAWVDLNPDPGFPVLNHGEPLTAQHKANTGQLGHVKLNSGGYEWRVAAAPMIVKYGLTNPDAGALDMADKIINSLRMGLQSVAPTNGNWPDPHHGFLQSIGWAAPFAGDVFQGV